MLENDTLLKFLGHILRERKDWRGIVYWEERKEDEEVDDKEPNIWTD